ncbi:MAG TPA: hypothetical protein VFG72_01335 [Marmoricola sp.]|nr:hypothetical protein [Marmoricola sp.]
MSAGRQTVRLTGDVVRTAGVLSFGGALIGGEGVPAALFALVLLGLTLLRLLVRPVLDAATGLVLVGAAWCSLLDLYLRYDGLDLGVHLAATGLAATALHEALTRLGLLAGADAAYLRHARAGVGLVVVTLGLALGVLWEVAEWFGHTMVDNRIQVGYDDTLGDLVAGGLGALVAWALLARAPAPRSHRSRPLERSTHG